MRTGAMATTIPAAHAGVKATLAGIARTLGAPPEKKAALTADLLAKALRRIPQDLAGLRDRALILIGFAAALRRSELVALDVEDIARHPKGLVVTIRRSKTDQAGVGKTKAIPHGRKLHAVQALDAWLAAAGIMQRPGVPRRARLEGARPRGYAPTRSPASCRSEPPRSGSIRRCSPGTPCARAISQARPITAPRSRRSRIMLSTRSWTRRAATCRSPTPSAIIRASDFSERQGFGCSRLATPGAERQHADFLIFANRQSIETMYAALHKPSRRRALLTGYPSRHSTRLGFPFVNLAPAAALMALRALPCPATRSSWTACPRPRAATSSAGVIEGRLQHHGRSACRSRLAQFRHDPIRIGGEPSAGVAETRQALLERAIDFKGPVAIRNAEDGRQLQRPRVQGLHPRYSRLRARRGDPDLAEPRIWVS